MGERTRTSHDDRCRPHGHDQRAAGIGRRGDLLPRSGEVVSCAAHMAAAIRAPFSTQWQRVTDHLSCDIAQGELFGLLGPNGAGKTTLMRMLATTVLPDSGTATVHGADVVRDARAVRGMIASVVANERALLWRISASDNLRYFAALLGLRGAARTARIKEVLELVEMTDTGEKMVGEFSSGCASGS